MDQEEFTRGYFKLLAEKFALYGYEKKKLIESVWAGTAAMVGNNGVCSNEEVFWKRFADIYGEKAVTDKSLFEEFYEKEFAGAKVYCGYNPKAAKAVQKIKKMGLRLALATNPIFPAVATETRIRWAGLEPSDFELYTTYENIGFCKPNPAYYWEIIDRLKVNPKECLMVGNDVTEDMAAREIGMRVYLLTDCLINKERKDINQFPRGSYHKMLKFIKEGKNNGYDSIQSEAE